MLAIRLGAVGIERDGAAGHRRRESACDIVLGLELGQFNVYLDWL